MIDIRDSFSKVW